MRQLEQLKQRLAALERENAELRAQIPHGKEVVSLSDDTTRVLVHLFRTDDLDDRDIGAMARALSMDRGTMQYHLDRLDEAKLAQCTGGNADGSVYWALTPEAGGACSRANWGSNRPS
jgi:DNA-binding MarR family transcriptional regulator